MTSHSEGESLLSLMMEPDTHAHSGHAHAASSSRSRESRQNQRRDVRGGLARDKSDVKHREFDQDRDFHNKRRESVSVEDSGPSQRVFYYTGLSAQGPKAARQMVTQR